jgi:hypothetical protein
MEETVFGFVERSGRLFCKVYLEGWRWLFGCQSFPKGKARSDARKKHFSFHIFGWKNVLYSLIERGFRKKLFSVPAKAILFF